MNLLLETFKSFEWERPAIYGAWLAQSYYYTRYSTRMLAFAAGWADQESQGYYRRSLQHIREEQGHDQIALNDLQRLGFKIEDLPELGLTRALWEPQFFKVQKSPMSLLGYILALEELAVRTFKPLFERLSAAHGAAACHFVKVHADDDPGHVEQALRQIEQCPPTERELIFANYGQTCDVYRLVLAELSAEVNT